jgi:hypothetical protein
MFRAGAFEGSSAGVDSCARSEHVIDEQDPFSGDRAAIANSKRAGHIPPAAR